jgi:hypothetical protein
MDRRQQRRIALACFILAWLCVALAAALHGCSRV